MVQVVQVVLEDLLEMTLPVYTVVIQEKAVPEELVELVVKEAMVVKALTV